jgi:hypothetical protein
VTINDYTIAIGTEECNITALTDNRLSCHPEYKTLIWNMHQLENTEEKTLPVTVSILDMACH